MMDAPRLELELVRGWRASRVTMREGGAELNAGQLDTLGVRRPRVGRLVRWVDGRGSSLVVSLRATARHRGTTARLELLSSQVDGCALRYAPGLTTPWNRQDRGRPMPLAGGGLVHSALADGESVLFEVACPIRDDEPRRLRTPRFSYRLTLNGQPAAKAVTPAMQRLRPTQQIRPAVPGRRLPERGALPRQPWRP